MWEETSKTFQRRETKHDVSLLELGSQNVKPDHSLFLSLLLSSLNQSITYHILSAFFLSFPFSPANGLLYFCMAQHGLTLYDLSMKYLPLPKVPHLSSVSQDRVWWVIDQSWTGSSSGNDGTWPELRGDGKEIRRGLCQPERPRAASLWTGQGKWSQ